MKMVINKVQWEAMGKQAGWYDIYKTVRKPMPPATQIHEDKRPTDVFTEDAADLETLKEEANQIALARGHTLGNWDIFEHGKGKGANNRCLACGREVQVLESPMPNEIDIGGEAVALNCN